MEFKKSVWLPNPTQLWLIRIKTTPVKTCKANVNFGWLSCVIFWAWLQTLHKASIKFSAELNAPTLCKLKHNNKKYNILDVQNARQSSWLLQPFAWCLWQTERDRAARREPWVSRCVYTLSCLLLSAARWDGTFPPQTEELKGYKVQISSLSQLARVHLSVHHASLQAIGLYLFINPPHPLFIAAILFHKVFAEAYTFWHTHAHTQTCTPFKLQYGIVFAEISERV